jgi:hypothetical protein
MKVWSEVNIKERLPGPSVDPLVEPEGGHHDVEGVNTGEKV